MYITEVIYVNHDLIKFYGAIGERIKQVRERRQYSQSKLSECSGVSQSQISRIEAGERMASVCMLVKIATALRVSIAYFVGDNCAID